ncbi:hypothetical protein A2867_03800 [Candidatus Daviesbacteria bacterium RIFCSPHIGHO2_01_FULL_40_11]|uniref:Uncharacterized protein n=1 Tax=Candidatus Daviesbacteria bacterium RIFCSPHIGHO2_01_FULL_40_11 TaxID=1797762 RepID=A0A1F5JG66_9BACT|nr:MAG: hypothetical protein A2867_03800 [Candidatus Daviesbacteria bacterium RIFCSPHIGHO2_01_FULL_40_11]
MASIETDRRRFLKMGVLAGTGLGLASSTVLWWIFGRDQRVANGEDHRLLAFLETSRAKLQGEQPLGIGPRPRPLRESILENIQVIKAQSAVGGVALVRRYPAQSYPAGGEVEILDQFPINTQIRKVLLLPNGVRSDEVDLFPDDRRLYGVFLGEDVIGYQTKLTQDQIGAIWVDNLNLPL